MSRSTISHHLASIRLRDNMYLHVYIISAYQSQVKIAIKEMLVIAKAFNIAQVPLVTTLRHKLDISKVASIIEGNNLLETTKKFNLRFNVMTSDDANKQLLAIHGVTIETNSSEGCTSKSKTAPQRVLRGSTID
jgi:hypothetical protein